MPKTSFLRKLIWLAGFAAAGLVLVVLFVLFVLFMALNVGGWRDRTLAKLGVVYNPPLVVSPPPGFVPQVPPGFEVSVFASGFEQPRWLAIAPGGDIFVADSEPGRIIVLQDRNRTGQAETRFAFAENLRQPFGIAFHDSYVYIGDTDEVVRFRYDPKTSRALGGREHILDLPGGGYNQHWTRTLAFSPDGTRLFVSVGSKSNVAIESDPRRGAIIESDPDGKNPRVYATGLRNAVGITFNPESGQLWAAVNERDLLGDDQPADYLTHVAEGGFYGWPYSYLGGHLDNRVSPRPDLLAKAIIPDLLLGAHVAPLEFVFYEAQQFPPAYLHGAFIAEHGSWNRRARAGYQVVFVPFKDGKPAGDPTPFLAGFVPDPNAKEVFGRMVGVTVAADGSLLISDDGGRLIWRVRYDGG
jgi:glucose/arabinose dehydrogenase